MTMKKNTCLGEINVTIGAIASLTGAAVSECIGVVGMASKQFFRDGIAVLLKQDNYSRGVVVRKTDKGIELDIYIIICYGNYTLFFMFLQYLENIKWIMIILRKKCFLFYMFFL